MFFQEINFLKKKFFSNAFQITDLTFLVNSKYIGFFFYLISAVILGRYFLIGNLIHCENADTVTSKEMIEAYCLALGLVTYEQTPEVSKYVYTGFPAHFYF